MEPADLVDIHAIERLKYRYLRCVDLKLWDELATCLTEDCSASYGGGTLVFEGRDKIIGFLSTAMVPTLLTSHKCHHPEIDLTGPDEATGVWALDDVVIDTTGGFTIRGAAFYTDRYVRADGTWLIRHTGYKRVYEEIQSRGDAASGGPTLTAEWWRTDGRSQLSA